MKKLLASAGAAAMLFGSSLPAFAASNLVLAIRSNGSMSINLVDIVYNNIKTIRQSNTTEVSTEITQDGDSGRNDMERNTGSVEGDSVFDITTGDVENDAQVDVTGGTNMYTDACDTCTPDTIDATVEGNGEESTNTTQAVIDDQDTTEQTNETEDAVTADQDGDSGKNDNNENTGSGDYRVTTGMVRNSLIHYFRGDLNTTGPVTISQ